MSGKVPTARELVDNVEMQLDTPIILKIVECLRQRLVKGHNTYDLTSEESGELSVGDIAYLRLLGYQVSSALSGDSDDEDDEREEMYTIYVPSDMLNKKVAASGAKRARTS